MISIIISGIIENKHACQKGTARDLPANNSSTAFEQNAHCLLMHLWESIRPAFAPFFIYAKLSPGDRVPSLAFVVMTG